MSKKADLIKTVIKISESALLNRYLKSRGINPEFVSKDQKVAHSKTNQFKTWATAHVNDPVRESITTEPSPTQQRLGVLKQSIAKHKEIRTTNGDKKLHSEAVDKKDTITFDIPLLIRVLEFAREDLKSDIALHQMVERLIGIRGKGTLTMNQYGQIVKEEVEQLDEISKEKLHAYAVAGHKKYDELRHKTDPASITKKAKLVKGIKKANTKMHPPLKPEPEPKVDFSSPAAYYRTKKGYVGDSVEVEGEPIQEGSAALRFAQALKRERESRELKDATRKARETQNSQTQQKPVQTKEDFFHGSAAAVGMPFDGANNPDDTIPAKRSKASIVKSVVKKIKEEMYDTEKEDKSTAPVGKKVKLQKPGVDVVTKESPKAAAVLSGGKTLTGEPRDTIEIDPMMKMRKQSPESQKSV